MIDLTTFIFFSETPSIAINCSNPTTVNQGDCFACECKGTGGNPPADVTWYNSSGPITTGKEKAILRFMNVTKGDCGNYICEAKSGIEKAKNETGLKVIVNCKYILKLLIHGI